jgi:predicted O-linked N-acetylglucosamine transferase (SPINDLY family)
VSALLAAAGTRLAAGEDAAARQICEDALALAPEHPGALNLLGLLAHRANDLPQAAMMFGRAVAATPDDPRAIVSLGAVQVSLGQLKEALGNLMRATELAPPLADAWYNLGRSLQQLGRVDDAIAAYRRVVALAPHDAEALNNLGLLLAPGAAHEAAQCFERALAIRPRFVGALYNLGQALQTLHRHGDAASCFQRALALRPGHRGAEIKLGYALRDMGRLDDAAAALERATRTQPDSPAAWTGYAVTLGMLARLEESETAFRRALALAPGNAGAHDDLLVALNYRRDVTAARALREAQAWDAAHAARFRSSWPRHDNDRDPDRVLRIGFITSNFGAHPVGYFVVRMLENIDRARYATYCYHAGQRDDPLVRRCAAAATSWVDAASLDDDALAARVRADALDVLVDQDGHYSGNRLLVYARKPAPVQATWHGWPSTTGLAAIDWLLADPHHVPPEAEADFVERILRLPDDMVCYDPPDYAPAVTESPASRNGFVTFAAFHSPAKLDPDCVAMWARVLAAVPGSRIVFKYRGVDAPSTRARLERAFAAAGVAATRVIVEPPSAHPALLARYGDADIALDATPYSGSTTTCEALWMGVPVVTLPGPRMFGRHTLAHLMTVGLPGLIARDEADYVAIAAGLAQDRARLATLRQGLRARMAASPLCDGPRLARNFAAALRTMWIDWLARVSAGGATTPLR